MGEALGPVEGRGHHQWLLELVVDSGNQLVVLRIDTSDALPDLLQHLVCLELLGLCVEVVVHEVFTRQEQVVGHKVLDALDVELNPLVQC